MVRGGTGEVLGIRRYVSLEQLSLVDGVMHSYRLEPDGTVRWHVALYDMSSCVKVQMRFAWSRADEEGWNEEQPWLSDVDAYSNAGKPSLEQMQKMLEGLPQNEETKKIKKRSRTCLRVFAWARNSQKLF